MGTDDQGSKTQCAESSPFDPPKVVKRYAGKSEVVDVDWNAVRALKEQGASNDQIERLYGVDPGTVACRAKSEGWLTPHRIKKARQEASQLRGPSTEGKQGSSDPAAAILALQDIRREELASEVHQGVMKAMREFFQDPQRTKLYSLDDAHKAVDLVKKVIPDAPQVLQSPALSPVNIGVSILNSDPASAPFVRRNERHGSNQGRVFMPSEAAISEEEPFDQR